MFHPPPQQAGASHFGRIELAAPAPLLVLLTLWGAESVNSFSSSLGALGWESAQVVFTYSFHTPAWPETMLQGEKGGLTQGVGPWATVCRQSLTPSTPSHRPHPLGTLNMSKLCDAARPAPLAATTSTPHLPSPTPAGPCPGTHFLPTTPPRRLSR